LFLNGGAFGDVRLPSEDTIALMGENQIGDIFVQQMEAANLQGVDVANAGGYRGVFSPPPFDPQTAAVRCPVARRNFTREIDFSGRGAPAPPATAC
jgi:hypothetical protein